MSARERRLDVLFVEPDSSAEAYQSLRGIYSAIETPTWSLLLAQSCRSRGFGVAILDQTAERLSDAQAVQRVRDHDPRLVCFVLYGQNPNSGTTSMIGGTRLAAGLKATWPEYPICFVGSHVSALPREVLSYDFIDMVLLNEGVYALHNLLSSDLSFELPSVRGIGYKQDGEIVLNPPERIVPQGLMDRDLPGYAWDLLPYEKRPLDLYRSHFWHTNYDHALRTPFAALYTSLGCTFRCDFCMINILNRADNAEDISAADSAVMRYWSPEFILGEFDKLADLGVETIRISDEMFFLSRKYFEPLLEGLIARERDLRLWTYARVDTVQPRYLEMFRKAGVKWLGIGIEAGNQEVRREVSKGKFQDVNIRDVVQLIHDHGISVGANYIFGFQDDTLETMQQTLDLACELNTPFANFYPCQALPGSPLHNVAKKEGWALPDSYAGYAFLSYECQPLPTKTLSAADVVRFRDEGWHRYFSRPEYLQLVEGQFGIEQRRNVEDLLKIRLKRRLLGD